MLRPLASIWDIAVPPTATPTTVDGIVATVTIVITVIVTVVGVFLATTRTVIVIPMVVIAVTANATAIGAGAPLLVVIRPITGGVGVIPEAHPEAVVLFVRPGTSMLPRTPIIGKLAFYVYVALGSRAWYPDEHLWRDKVEVLQTRRVSVSKSNPKFAFLSVHTTIVRKVTSDKFLLCSPPFL
jgi:hypothetical protein